MAVKSEWWNEALPQLMAQQVRPTAQRWLELHTKEGEATSVAPSIKQAQQLIAEVFYAQALTYSDLFAAAVETK